MMGTQGSSGTGTGSNANVYTPTAQPAADQMYQDTVRMLANAGFGPAGTNYPTGQSFVDQYITGSPYAPQALIGAQTAADQAGTLYPYQAGSGYNLQGAASTGLPYGFQALQQGFGPGYQQLVDYTQQNPYFGTALAGASQAANIGGQAASNLQRPGYSLLTGAGDVLNTAFDPRGALFNRTQGQVMDQASVANALSGVAGSPYGAGVTADALKNFDIDWQNQQLARQQSGLGAAGTAIGQGANTLAGSANLAASSAALPSSTYLGQLNAVANALRAQQTGAALGGNTFSNLLGSAGGAYQQGAGLQNNALQQYLSGTQQPYNTGLGIANNALSGLSNVTNLGNQQYALPQEVLNALSAYLRLGQAASLGSGQLGQLGFNQTAQGLGGLISGANTLFGGGGTAGSGSSGLFGSAGLLNGLFGSGGAAAGADFGGGGAALGIPDALGLNLGAADLAAGAGGGGSSLLGALPIAASA